MPDCSSAEPAFDHGLRRQAIVKSILTDIFHGRLHAGQRLVTESLANRFHVSHTPIREALIELCGIGVVELLPNRGAVVRAVTASDIHDVCEVRRILECEATAGAAHSVDLATVQRIDTDIRALSCSPVNARAVSRAQELDTVLHDTIREACGNRFLAAELKRLRTLFHAFRDVTWELELLQRDFHRIGVEATEHLAITAALLARDRKRAKQAMASHIRSGITYWTLVTAYLTQLPHEHSTAVASAT